MQPNTRVLGLYGSFGMLQPTDILHWNIDPKYLDRRGYPMPPSHTSMAIANVEQAKARCLNNVFDGKLVSISALLAICASLTWQCRCRKHYSLCLRLFL